MKPSDYPQGARVVMTQAAIDQGLDGNKRRRTGIVQGRSRIPSLIKVIREGEKRPSPWACEFWSLAAKAKRRGEG